MTTFTSYPDRLKEVQTTLVSIEHPNGFHKYIRMTSISHPSIIVRIIDWSKQVLHVITTACHGPRPPPAKWRDKRKWQQVTSHDHFTWSPTTISDSRITYHDLCQTTRRVIMALPPPSVIMTTQNISPSLKKESKLAIISTFTQRRR